MTIINPLNIGAITPLGSGYLPLAALQIPVRSGLKGAFFLGHGAKVAQKNFAPGGVDAAYVGTPTEGAGFMEFSSTAFLQTDVDETLAMTYMIVGRRKTGGTTGGFIGNYVGSGAIGVSLYCQAANITPWANTGRVGGGGTATSTGGSIDDFALLGLVADATNQVEIYNFTNNSANTGAGSAARAISGGGKIRIGALYSGSFPGPVQIAAALIYDRALSDTAERNAMRDFLRDYCDSIGLTV